MHDDKHVRVFVRVRPTGNANRLAMVSNNNEISLERQGVGVGGERAKRVKRFRFQHVFDESATQEDVFEHIGVPMVDKCLDGFNGCILAYGQTGSGKTHTISGSDASDQSGLIPRVLAYLFDSIEKANRTHSSSKFSCSVTFLEIYNEQVRDLLNDKQEQKARWGGKSDDESLQIREDKTRGVHVKGLREEQVSDAQDALEWLRRGVNHRKTASTSMNETSSRSHSVFSLHLTHTTVEDVHSKAGVITRKREITSRLQLVDLAGSERQNKTNAAGRRLKEASAINTSLTNLGLVVNTLSQAEQKDSHRRGTLGARRRRNSSSYSSCNSNSNSNVPHVHYRDSKLTWLLRDSLGGNAHTTLCAMVSPEQGHAAETLGTLQFAERAAGIKTSASQNLSESAVGGEATATISLLEDELQRLRQLLRNMSGSNTSGGVGAGAGAGAGDGANERDAASSASSTETTPAPPHRREAEELNSMLLEALEQAEALMVRQEELQAQLGALSQQCDVKDWQIKAHRKAGLQKDLLIKLLQAQTQTQTQTQTGRQCSGVWGTGAGAGSSSSSSSRAVIDNEWYLPQPSDDRSVHNRSVHSMNGSDSALAIAQRLENSHAELQGQLERQARAMREALGAELGGEAPVEAAEMAEPEAEQEQEQRHGEEKVQQPTVPRVQDGAFEHRVRQLEKEMEQQQQEQQRREAKLRKMYDAVIQQAHEQQAREVTISTAQAEVVSFAVENAKLKQRLQQYEQRQPAKQLYQHEQQQHEGPEQQQHVSKLQMPRVAVPVSIRP